MKKDKITLFTIAPSKKNPYPYLLINHLKKEELEIKHHSEFSHKKKNPVNNNIIVHYHWLFDIFNRTSFFKNIYLSLARYSQMILAKKRGVNYCWTIHNLEPHENKWPLLNKLNHKIMARIVNSIIVMSKWQKCRIMKKFSIEEKKISVIPHGHYISYYKNKVSKKEARKKLNIKEDKFVYLFFGAIRKYKGILELIKSFKKIKKKDSLLLIVGDTSKDPSLKKDILKLKDNSIITKLEFIEEDKIQYYFNSADVVVFPFNKITNSGSLLLAMSFKKPIICKNIGAPSEIVNDRIGILYNENKLEDSMIKIRKKDLESMGKAAFKKAKKYNWKLIAKKHKKVYEKTLKNNK